MKLSFEFKIKPHVCDVFQFKNKDAIFKGSKFRIDHWLKENSNGRLIFCGRADATWVSGTGTCGCIAHLDDIVTVGQVNWDKNYIKERQDDAEKKQSWHTFDIPRRH